MVGMGERRNGPVPPTWASPTWHGCPEEPEDELRGGLAELGTQGQWAAHSVRDPPHPCLLWGPLPASSFQPTTVFPVGKQGRVPWLSDLPNGDWDCFSWVPESALLPACRLLRDCVHFGFVYPAHGRIPGTGCGTN